MTPSTLPSTSKGVTERNTHLLDWLADGHTHCQHGTKEWCEGYLHNARDVIKAQDAALTALQAEARAAAVRWQENWDANVQEMSEKFRAVNLAKVMAGTNTDLLDRALAAEAELAAMKEGAAEPVAWLHEITESGATEPMSMLSKSRDNPWSHWMAAHRDKCVYRATPLFAHPAPADKGVLEAHGTKLNEAHAAFHRASARADALEAALRACRTFIISCRAEAKGRNQNRFDHADELIGKIDEALPLAASPPAVGDGR